MDRATLNWSAEMVEGRHDLPDKPARVRAMFERIAARYDLANRVNSLGQDQRWRRLAVRMAGLTGGETVLDVACGTGDLAATFAHAGAKCVTGLDFCEPMLAVARRKYADLPIDWLTGDATALPAPDTTFDVVSIGFGLRNLAEPLAALVEFARVLQPGGRLVVLEFARPGRSLLGRASRAYLSAVVPAVGAMISGDRDGAYRYLAGSIESYLTFNQMGDSLRDAGYTSVRGRRLMFGAVGIHVGVRR